MIYYVQVQGTKIAFARNLKRMCVLTVYVPGVPWCVRLHCIICISVSLVQAPTRAPIFMAMSVLQYVPIHTYIFILLPTEVHMYSVYLRVYPSLYPNLQQYVPMCATLQVLSVPSVPKCVPMSVTISLHA